MPLYFAGGTAERTVALSLIILVKFFIFMGCIIIKGYSMNIL
jgi:hypothetical protein